MRHDQQWTSGGPLNSVSIRVHWASGPNEWLVGCSTVYLVYQTSMLLFNEVQCSDPFLPSFHFPSTWFQSHARHHLRGQVVSHNRSIAWHWHSCNRASESYDSWLSPMPWRCRGECHHGREGGGRMPLSWAIHSLLCDTSHTPYFTLDCSIVCTFKDPNSSSAKVHGCGKVESDLLWWLRILAKGTTLFECVVAFGTRMFVG